MNDQNTSVLNDELEIVEVVTEIDLFSEELEDHFNAAIGSTAATVGCGCGCLSSVSTLCSMA